MGRIGIAFSAFFRCLFNANTALRVQAALAGMPPAPQLESGAKQAPAPKTEAAASKPASTRSDALTMLASLQREGRFIDFLMEDVSSYSDEQIGAAARQIHRGCRAVVQRSFAPQRIVDQNEGEAIEVPKGYDGQRYQLVGQVAGSPPFHGKVTHHGWRASQQNLPQWKGDRQAADVIAPIEVEL